MAEPKSPAQIIRDYLAAAAHVAPRQEASDAGAGGYQEDPSYGGTAVIDPGEEMAQRFGRMPQPQNPAPVRIGRTEKEIMRDTKLPFTAFATGLRQLNSDGYIVSRAATLPSPGAPAGIMEYALLVETIPLEERRQIMSGRHTVWKMGLGE